MDEPEDRRGYRLSLEEFETTVGVPAEARVEVVGLPAEASPMSGDEAAAIRWSSGRGIGSPGDIDMGDGDGD